MTTKQPAIATYREAVSEIQNAVNALDQAHAMLKDIDLHNYIATKVWGRFANIQDAVNLADGLLRDLQNATCPDCGKPMAEAEDCLLGHCPNLS